MKNPKYLLRILQILTGVTIVAIVAMLFGFLAPILMAKTRQESAPVLQK